jgi:hypothetical protein
MDSDGAGTGFGLVDPNDSYSSSGVCAKSCLAQRIDVATRTVTSQKLDTLAAGRIIATRHDSVADKLVVGYMKLTNGYYSPRDPYPGYGVTLLDYR